MANDALLKGWRVIIIRQPDQARALSSLITEMQGQAEVLATVNVIPLSISDQNVEIGCEKIKRADFIFVVSQSAIQCAPKRWQEALTQADGKIITMGKSTSQALQDQRIPIYLTPPPGTTSESLLAMPFLHADKVNGKSIVILAGEAGRDVIATTLQQRGGQVDYLLTYRQERLSNNYGNKIDVWRTQSRCLFTAFSSRSLEYLLNDLLPHQKQWLMTQPLIVISERIAAQAKEWGFKQILISQSALPEDMKSALHRVVQFCDT